jgi:H/ACA ribonucleoprotein complex subunit 3
MTRSLILWCPKDDGPTLEARCPTCGAATINPLPPRYSPEDPYGKYRRAMKRLARATEKAPAR